MADIYDPNIVDPELWDEAEWQGMGFLSDPSGEAPPGLGPVFRNEQAAKRIFGGWLHRFGDRDELDQIRVVIAEGDIAGQPAGYTVLVGVNPAGVLDGLRAERGNDLPRYVAAGTRCFREATADSTNLARFKAEMERAGSFRMKPP